MKKESLSIMIVKTLLAVIIFAGMWIIIISGVYLIGGYGKIKTPVFRGPGIFIDGHFKRVSNIELPISETGAKTIVKEFCEPENQDNAYGYDTIKEVDNEWRIQIINMNGLCYAAVNVKSGETNCTKCNNAKSFPPFDEVTITTDKTEYEQGETAEITVKNNLNNLIKHLKGVGCGLQGFSNEEWTNVSSKSCMWEGESKLKSNSEYNFNWTSSMWGLEKYRIAFHYQEQKLIETKEIGKIICESKKLPDELEELLANGKWMKNDVEPCIMCAACGCGCTTKNVWTVNEISIDVHEVSCFGNSYTIKYKGEEYSCVPENYKNPLQRLPIPIPSEDWNVIYSNEFTIKEKSALDPRCSEKVIEIVLHGDSNVLAIGYEYDLEAGRCVKKTVSGCSIQTPFKTLEECQEVCEESKNVPIPFPPIETVLTYCNNDSDCVLVDPEVCDCNSCKTKAINRKYVDEWNHQACILKVYCPGVEMFCESYKVKCDNNKCIAVKKHL